MRGGDCNTLAWLPQKGVSFLHMCITYMSYILLCNHFTWVNFYLTWVDAPETFYAPGMFDVSGTKEASKASSKEIRDI